MESAVHELYTIVTDINKMLYKEVYNSDCVLKSEKRVGAVRCRCWKIHEFAEPQSLLRRR